MACSFVQGGWSRSIRLCKMTWTTLAMSLLFVRVKRLCLLASPRLPRLDLPSGR